MMTKIFKTLPWVGMAIFAFLYFIKTIDLAVVDHYSNDSYGKLAEDHQSLENYVIARKSHSSDLAAFEALELIQDYQYDGKYSPWLNTKIGLVRFDETGFIIQICDSFDLLNSTDCPPNL